MVYFGSTPHPGCNRHHQDYYILSGESSTKPLFATGTGWGVDPRYTYLHYLVGFCMINVGKYSSPIDPMG